MLIKLAPDQRNVGGVALGGIWIGNSDTERKGCSDCGAVLNVAQDLQSTRGWPLVEEMHVGLIDGPGNEVVAYVAAVLALHALRKRHNVLVCCHTGGRALAVALMYLSTAGHRTWEQWLKALNEQFDDLPPINDLHYDAFTKVADVLDNVQWKQ